MFAKWLEEYRKLSQKTRFVSKLGTFLVSLFAFLSCWRLLDAAYQNPIALDRLWNNILISVICHVLIGVIFVIRFGSLFFNTTRSFWVAQTFWLIGLSALFSFFTITRFTFYGGFFAPISNINFGMHDYEIFFLYTSYQFTFFGVFYFFASPVRQILTAIFAFIKSK